MHVGPMCNLHVGLHTALPGNCGCKATHVSPHLLCRATISSPSVVLHTSGFVFLASAKMENYATYGGPTHILSQQPILTSTYTALKINYTDLPSSGIGMEFQVGLQFHSIPLVMPIPFQPIIIPLIFPKAIA